jgi:hypothetical protein
MRSSSSSLHIICSPYFHSPFYPHWFTLMIHSAMLSQFLLSNNPIYVESMTHETFHKMVTPSPHECPLQYFAILWQNVFTFQKFSNFDFQFYQGYKWRYKKCNFCKNSHFENESHIFKLNFDRISEQRRCTKVLSKVCEGGDFTWFDLRKFHDFKKGIISFSKIVTFLQIGSRGNTSFTSFSVWYLIRSRWNSNWRFLVSFMSKNNYIQKYSITSGFTIWPEVEFW